jgi:hypothetical protein
MDRKREAALFMLLVAAALFAYLATCARALLGGDNGEFLVLAARGGVAHPPGYPLYTMYLRAMAWMPGANVAESAARATALLAAGSVVAAHFAARAWGASHLAATIGACAWATLPLAWKMAVHAEVFALNALLGAIVLGVSGPASSVRGGTRLVLLGLASGAGLANHHTIVFLFPVGVAGIVRAFKEERARPVAAALAAAAFAIGAGAPYAWLVHESHAARGWTWRGPMTAGDAWRHFLRADYWTQRSSVVSTVMNEPGLQLPGWSRMVEQLGSILEDVPAVSVALAGVGFLRLALRRAARRALEGATIATAFVLAGPWGNGLHVLKPYGIGRVIVERFYVLPQLLLCVGAAVGVDVALARVRRRALAAGLVCFAFAARAAVFTVAEVREYTRPTVELYVRNTLKSLPRDAVVLGSGDHRFFGFLYVQEVLGMRPDVAYIDFKILPTEWYRARVARRAGIAVPAPEGPPVSSRVVEALLATGRPVFLASHVERLSPELPRFPWGTVHRVLERRTLEPDPFTVEETNLRLFETMERETSRPADKWSWAGDLDATYDQAWLDLAKTFEAAGMKDEAAACMRRVR